MSPALKILAVSAALAGLAHLSGCGSIYDTFNIGAASVSENASQGTTTPVTYAQVNAQIFTPICLRCHSNATGNNGGVNLETYQSVLNNLTRATNAIDTNVMPFDGPPLSQDLKNLLHQWINQGTPLFTGPSAFADDVKDDDPKTSEEVYFQTESLPKDSNPPLTEKPSGLF